MRAFYCQPLAVTLLFLTGISAGSLARAETILEVRFSGRNVSFSGKIDSEETGQRLAKAVQSVRPDLAIVNAGLKISQDVVMPDLDDLENVLTELGLSTHGGRIEIATDYILIGGITDSIVTITALRIRIEPLLQDRRFINRICVVHSDDLPDLKISLSTTGGEVELLDFEYHPSVEEMFEAPGLPLHKWFPTLVMLSDFDRLEGIKKAPLVAQPLNAQPLIAMPIGGVDADQVFKALEEQDANPQPTYETIGSISFSRNAFLLQANQESAIEAVAKALTSPALKGKDVILKPIKPSSGSGAYNDYLCEKRADEVKRILSETGVLPANVFTEISTTPSPVDDGEVLIVVKIPPLPPEEKKETTETVEGKKVMVGTTIPPDSNPEQRVKKNAPSEEKIPEHPLKQFRLKTKTE